MNNLDSLINELHVIGDSFDRMEFTAWKKRLTEITSYMYSSCYSSELVDLLIKQTFISIIRNADPDTINEDVIHFIIFGNSNICINDVIKVVRNEKIKAIIDAVQLKEALKE